MSYRAELIAVGTELLLGNIANTDAQMLSEGLSALGIDVYWHTVVGDNPGRLKDALAIAKQRANIIITTGGLGPTYDDLTKQTICESFGLPLEFHEEIWQEICRYFTKLRGVVPTDNNRQQAMLPVGCTILDNPVGTAPGCAFEKDGIHVLMLPGPPYECRYMFEHKAVPYLRGLTEEQLYSHNLRIFGMGESTVEDLLRDKMVSLVNPTLAPYAKTGEVLLRATAKAKDKEQAEAMLRPLINEVHEVLGDVIYGEDVESLEEVLLKLCMEKGVTLSFAESCTGGLIAARFTDLPGASKVFRGGVVSYTNDVKESALGVPHETLEQFGAVSAETAVAMAEGCRRLTGSDIALSVTGVAGPDKDDRGNDVGTVYLGVATEKGSFSRLLDLSRGRGRGHIRYLAASHAFDVLRRLILSEGKAE